MPNLIPDSFFQQYEQELLRLITGYGRRVRKLYNGAIDQAAQAGGNINSKNFNLNDYPVLRARMNESVAGLRQGILSEMNNAIGDAWGLANAKNNSMVNTILGRYDLPKQTRLFDLNRPALTAFRTRQEFGLNLSERIWNFVKPFRHELEAGLADGINNGRSAAQMSRDMRRYLNEPDRLFRRVRDESGQLQLSPAAQAYHPGQGVYRSSYKNAMRLTRTETNMAYRNADHERWMKNDYVIGQEIKLSLSHPKYDICDPLSGIYPKAFKWAGWHPHCLCYAIPVLLPQKSFEDAQRDILGTRTGAPIDPKKSHIKKIPQAFTDYVEENRERIEGWRHLPYWWRDNQDFINP